MNGTAREPEPSEDDEKGKKEEKKPYKGISNFFDYLPLLANGTEPTGLFYLLTYSLDHARNSQVFNTY